MARSMTGFGRAEMNGETLHLSVEIKSVNNRYLDFNFRMPRKMNCFEAKIRALLSEEIKRGKVDVFISCYDNAQAAAGVRFNKELAEKYLSIYKEISSMEGVAGPVLPSDIARCPEVIQVEDVSLDEDEVYAALEGVLKEALAQFTAARETEGEHLKEDILEKLDVLEEGAREVAAHEPEIIEAYRTKILEKMTELLQDSQVEESRLLTEAALFADRISTDEEQVLTLNAKHPLVQYLEKGTDTENEKLIAEQMYDLARLQNSPLEADAMTRFIERSNKIMQMIADNDGEKEKA